MTIINDLNETRFTFNGVQYLKNYVSAVRGNRIIIFNCYDNKDVLLELTPYDEITLNGATYASAADLQADLLSVIYVRTTLGEGTIFYQNNTGRSIYIGQVAGTNLLTEIPAAINALPITILATEAIILFWAYQQSEDGLIRLQYLFKGGKGDWGSIGTDITYSQLIPLAEIRPTVSDVENDAAATIIPLGELPDGDYLTAANAEEHDFSDAGEETASGVKTYYFSYTVPGEGENPDVLYLVLFVGTPGIYGGAETAFTSDDFAATTNSEVQPTTVPTLMQVMAANNNVYNIDMLLYNGAPGAIINGTAYGANYIHYGLGGNDTAIKWEDPTTPDREILIRASAEHEAFAYMSDVIAPFGFPLTKKSQGRIDGVSNTGDALQPNDGCFGSAMITDPVTGETIEADIIDAVYNGPDPESQGSYTIKFFNPK